MKGTIVQNNSSSSEFEQTIGGIHKKPATIFITNFMSSYRNSASTEVRYIVNDEK